jgi:hypothetical protein
MRNPPLLARVLGSYTRKNSYGSEERGSGNVSLVVGSGEDKRRTLADASATAFPTQIWAISRASCTGSRHFTHLGRTARP